MKCPNCSYIWNYNGTLRRVMCPNCGKQWFREPIKPTAEELNTKDNPDVDNDDIKYDTYNEDDQIG